MSGDMASLTPEHGEEYRQWQQTALWEAAAASFRQLQEDLAITAGAFDGNETELPAKLQYEFQG